MEVLVTFLEGDPDQPLVSGCLYHKEHEVPYALPANKTRSLFKTLSSPGGGGFNELRIEDKKGAEQIFVHAQRDWDQNIQHDQKIRIGHERHDTVEQNAYSEFKAEEHRTTHGARKTEIRADDHLTVAGTQHLKLGVAQLTQAGREIHLKAGDKIVIEAALEMTLKAGGSFIKLDPGGITVLGPLVKANAGGAPGSGSGIGIKPPLQPGRRTGMYGGLAPGRCAQPAGAGVQGMPGPGQGQQPSAGSALEEPAMYTSNPLWHELLWQQVHRLEHEHLDLLIDATRLDYPLLQELAAQADGPPLAKLFDSTRKPPSPMPGHCCCG
ncbi:hypothetical protein PBOI14_28650 [Pseudomonas sp. Boi14]|nr:hypothetical protein PBOI14_28650 [Pseudomonas sp. Boi14]